MRVDALRHEAGFTIIEVLVAITLLLIGVLGVATIADSANVTATTNKARVGATNLAREMIEDARTFKYAELTGDLPAPSGGATDLQDAYTAIGITDASASVADYQIARRGITYNVHVFTCIMDDAHDGVRATANPDVNSAGIPYCLGSAASAGTATDSNPDDARKVEVSVTWTLGSRGVAPDCKNAKQTSSGGQTNGIGTACVVQSELIANPTGGLGPGIRSITQTAPAAPFTTIEPNSTSVTLHVVTTFAAESVVWSADEGSNGTAIATDTTNTQWDITWGSWGSATPIDGSHIVTVQAFLLNAGGVPRETSVNFNRFIPQAPDQSTLKGGVDTRIDGTLNTATSQPAASINWLPVTGNDILGYTVYRVRLAAAPDSPVNPPVPVMTGPSNVRDTPVCSTASALATSCFDAPGVKPTDLESVASHAACPSTADVNDKCINYYVVPFDQKWQVYSDALGLVRNNLNCVPSPYTAGVTTLDPPDSVPPLTASSGWSSARTGCPSAILNINYTQAIKNAQPNGPTAPTSCTTDSGQPVIGWTPPSNPGNYTSYRIYRDPPSTPPGYNDPATTINFGTPTPTSSFKDPNPTNGTGHTYYVTVVDDKFQESAPLPITWTAGGCP